MLSQTWWERHWTLPTCCWQNDSTFVYKRVALWIVCHFFFLLVFVLLCFLLVCLFVFWGGLHFSWQENEVLSIAWPKPNWSTFHLLDVIHLFSACVALVFCVDLCLRQQLNTNYVVIDKVSSVTCDVIRGRTYCNVCLFFCSYNKITVLKGACQCHKIVGKWIHNCQIWSLFQPKYHTRRKIAYVTYCFINSGEYIF